ncbi:uncharacterized protein LOC110610603 isoform X2 [Manihot esculenta]|uniref:Uncharacterized protein n=1 Tax=Manihot esculenta TaxID=3983 RepID=A0ACB7HZV5_MANES|nr:uncharacterized protein LOC110610603 isoform X2 [Manihot esculenta]KAG8658060.1 hypothetical protein MANES_03G116000v8 [Manihot esculenta]
MTSLLQISVLNILHDDISKKFICSHSLPSSKITSFTQSRFRLRANREKLSVLELGSGKDGMLVRDEGWKRKRRVVLVRFNQGFGFNGGGGGGGGGRDNSGTIRLLGNVALAIGLTYLSMTGQLGWIFDAIGWVLDIAISIWLLAVLIPIVGVGAFLWWAGRDMLQGTCPNCGNDFQIFKSTLNDELQLCPFCSQPFSVEDEFVRDSVKFSNSSTTFGQAFRDFSARSEKGKDSSSVVDIEAEIKDAD